MNTHPELKLDRLHDRHPGLTQALGESYTEAACVCWSRHHAPPVTVSLRHDKGDEHRIVNFAVPDARARDAYANEIDTTEMGAYGVSLAAVEDVEGLVAMSGPKRSQGRIGTSPPSAPLRRIWKAAFAWRYQVPTLGRVRISIAVCGTKSPRPYEGRATCRPWPL
jgi:hypothetical protein